MLKTHKSALIEIDTSRLNANQSTTELTGTGNAGGVGVEGIVKRCIVENRRAVRRRRDGSVGDADGMRHTAIGRESLLEVRAFRSQHIPAALDHPAR